MEEESKIFSADKIFYNPEMRFCRSFSSLAVGAIGEKLNVLDGFCASGIRGIRYAKENKNVSSVTFLDWSKNAIALAKKNAAKNKISARKAKIVNDDIVKFLVADATDFEFNFIELDPFGTPAPYLFAVFFRMNQSGTKTFYLSATATDTAVLCGHEKTACLKNYHAKSLNNEFTHENGLRILIRRIAEAASEFNFGISPLVSLSDRHYLKVIVKCESSAAKSDENIRNFGYISYCEKCGWRESWGKIIEKCGNCGNETRWGGPLWIGRLNDGETLSKMRKLNGKKDYEDIEEIEKILALIEGEIEMPPGYYNVHRMCRRISMKSVPKMSKIIEELNSLGFKTMRTHFSDVSLKSAANAKEFADALLRITG
ncbi:MAG: tRNA (guanine(10)-N(2))-dimethyltransferase [Candidatus Micrarchaeota archaeon]